jgi:hypothetical protein
MGDRDPERRHDRVPDELLYRPALGFDLLAHRAEVRSHDLLQTLGIQALSEPGRAGDVGEQDRDEASLLSRRRGLGAEPRAARGAEESPGRDHGAAHGTARD